MSEFQSTASAPAIESPVSVPVATAKRFDGLDGVRATAMLLGVFYHLPIAMYAGGFGMGFGFGGGGSPKAPIDLWLHSFRMPLFFLISGFFANMMLQKYGWKKYFARRWWRIGAPLVIAFFALGAFRIAVAHFRPVGAGPFGAPGFGGPQAPGPGFGQPPRGNTSDPPPAGGAPPEGGPATPPGGPPRFGGPPQFGGPPAGNSPFRPPFGGPPGGWGNPPFGPPGGINPANTTPPLTFVMPKLPPRVWNEKLFGPYGRHFQLEHLWFLWYLLIFVTIGPPVIAAISRPAKKLGDRFGDAFGSGLLRWNVFAVLLGLVTLPVLLHARGTMGWSLANPHGFLGAFPDFLIQYYPDEPYYFLYFLTGWWLYRGRGGLSHFADWWLWNLTLGVAGFAISQQLSGRFSQQTDLPHFEWYRLGGFALYGVGAAFSACGLIGLFQKFFDRPTPVGRYLVDTALWIYLIHLPLIPYLIWWVQPAGGAWWVSSLGGMIVVAGVSLVLFELLIRPTPLVHIFGPPTIHRPTASPPQEVPARKDDSA